MGEWGWESRLKLLMGETIEGKLKKDFYRELCRMRALTGSLERLRMPWIQTFSLERYIILDYPGLPFLQFLHCTGAQPYTCTPTLLIPRMANT